MKEAEVKLAALKFANDMCAATRRAVIEECAKVADEFKDSDAPPEVIAEAIRSLLAPPLKDTQFRTGTEEVSTPESVTDSPSRTSPDPSL